MSAEPASLLLSSMGLVTCVGYGVGDSCASLRAGIVRRSPLLGLEQFDEIDLSGPVNGGVVANLAEGFSAAAAWTALGSFAIGELVHRMEVPLEVRAAFAAETSLICAGPELDGPRFGWPEPEQVTAVGTDLLAQLQAALALRFHETSAALWSGHAGAGDAILAAAKLLSQGKCARALLVGADTLVDADSVRWLESEGRLKTEELPVGVCPGEAAGCLLLERSRPGQDGTKITGCAVELPSVTVSHEPFASARIAVANAIGKAMAAAVERALRQATVTLPFAGDLFVDLNGEEWRAHVWGHAQVALAGLVDFDSCNVIVPASSFAETGAASGFAGLCAAAQSMERGYARTPNALICCVAESGRAAAVVMTARV